MVFRKRSAKKSKNDVYLSENLYNFEKNGQNKNDKIVMKISDIKAPICKNTVVGKAYLVGENGVVIEERDLVVKQEIESLSYIDIFDKIIYNW